LTICRAKQARNLAQALSCPSNTDLKAILRMDGINDCTVVQDVVVLAEKIFGKDIAILKGKTVCDKPKPVVHDIVHIHQS
jgi:hypothetical protein